MRTPFLLLVAAPAAFAPLAAAQNAPLLQPTGLGTVNSALNPVAISRTMVAFAASENAQGADLNGDLDAADWVMQIHDLRSGNTRSLGHAVSATVRPAATDRHVVFYVHEASDGSQDGNGDGDHADFAAYLFDRATGQVREVGIAVNPNIPPVMNESYLVVSASEQSTGQGGTDLDGDGVISECVWVVDLATGIGAAAGPRPVGVDIANNPAFVISGTRVYWRALADRHAWVSDRATGIATDLGWRAFSAVHSQGGIAAFALHEAENGQQDLSGDGDANDVVVAVVGSNGGPTTILPLEGAANLPTLIALGPHRLVALRPEGGPFGQDLNGDADTLDRVLHVYDDRTGALVNLGRAYAPAGPLLADVEGERIAFGVAEQAVDWNGDGDVSDLVVEMIDGSNTSIAFVGLAVRQLAAGSIQISRGQLGILVDEAAQGVDFDGDGQLLDVVPHVFDPVRWWLPPVNLGVSTLWSMSPAFHFHQGRASLIVRESNVDLNGDGDVFDNVLVVRGTTPNSTLDTNVAMAPGFATATNAQRERDGVIVFTAVESVSGNTSLNGDADTADIVAFVVRMNP